MHNGYSKIPPAVFSFYFVAVLPSVLVKLDVVHDHENIRAGDLMEIAQPGDIMQLVG